MEGEVIRRGRRAVTKRKSIKEKMRTKNIKNDEGKGKGQLQ